MSRGVGRIGSSRNPPPSPGWPTSLSFDQQRAAVRRDNVSHGRGRLHGTIGLAVNENGTVPELDCIPCNVGRAARADKRDLLLCELAGPRGRRRRPCLKRTIAAARTLASEKGSRRTRVPDGLIV